MAYKSPVYHVIPVPIEKVRPNTYKPNAVAPPEMRLLYESIRADGYTMPIVCYYAKSQDIYVIVDGFHRYRVMLEHPDIYEREGGVLPVSVIDKPLDQRMASTIRHNRARGSHDVDLMIHKKCRSATTEIPKQIRPRGAYYCRLPLRLSFSFIKKTHSYW